MFNMQVKSDVPRLGLCALRVVLPESGRLGVATRLARDIYGSLSSAFFVLNVTSTRSSPQQRSEPYSIVEVSTKSLLPQLTDGRDAPTQDSRPFSRKCQRCCLNDSSRHPSRHRVRNCSNFLNITRPAFTAVRQSNRGSCSSAFDMLLLVPLQREVFLGRRQTSYSIPYTLLSF